MTWHTEQDVSADGRVSESADGTVPVEHESSWEPDVSAHKPVLLIAEDEPDLLDLYRQGLEIVGAKVYGAEDGERAWETFLEHQDEIDLVISDIFMPGMNGVQLMNRVKTKAPNIPVFLITGYAHLHTLVEESSYEPDAYLEKPFNLPDLFRLLQKLLPGALDFPEF